MHKAILLALVPLLLRAEVRTLTLREAVTIALEQNPSVVMARLDRLKALLGVDIAKDPFVPKVYGGSGAAYTSGFPGTINGSPPSIFDARALMAIFNRPQSYLVAQARENVRGSEIEVGRQQDEIAFRTAALYLDAEQAARAAATARQQADSMQKVLEAVRQRVGEGRELPIQSRRAELDVAKARQRAESFETDQVNAESALAIVLGFPPDDRVRPAAGVQGGELPSTAGASVENAISNNKQVKLIESQMQSKELEMKSYRAQKLPTIDLIAQYSLLSKYNFEDFYQKFQRHNGTLGASFTFPILVGRSARAYAAQGEADLARLKAQYTSLRSQIAADVNRSSGEVRRAETARDVAKLDLDVAREQVSVFQAQYEEGRVSVREVEGARAQETDKWLAYYQAQHDLERARLELLRQTGTLTAALQ